MDLSHRTALVTGGLSGIGLAVARRLAEAGAAVAVGGRRERPEAVDRLRATGGRVFAAPLDVTDAPGVAAYLAALEKALGAPDLVINAAGIYDEAPVMGHDDAMWQRMLDINLTGAFNVIRATLPGMTQAGFGRIVNIGSTAATTGAVGNAAYCASKAGLLGLTRCVALEGAPHGVTCTMVSPSWVDTEMLREGVARLAAAEGRAPDTIRAEIAASSPQNRVIDPAEIAELVAYLCSDAARGLTNEDIRLTGGAPW